jgi:phosphohistidine phosphatase SixA
VHRTVSLRKQVSAGSVALGLLLALSPHAPAARADPSAPNLSAVIEGTEVRLQWTSLERAKGTSATLVLRRLNQAPTGPRDGEATVIYRGSESQATDAITNLLAEREYVYAAYGCRNDGECDAWTATARVKPTLIAALRAGGYVVYWRHATADALPDDRNDLGTADNPKVPDWWRKCDSQYTRQLSPVGIAQATEIGEQLRKHEIPFGRMVTSEFCRNVRTAELMNLGIAIELSKGITNYVYDDSKTCDHTYALLRESPRPGTNTGVIGHTQHISCPLISKPDEAMAVIFKPDGAGNTEFIRRVLASQWAGLE